MPRRLAVIALILTVSGIALAQTPAQPNPSPTPRRPLPKPTGGSRGFQQFAGRDASARLIAAGATRVVVDPGDHFTRGEAHYKERQYAPAVKELREAIKQSPDWDDPHYVLALSLTELGKTKEAIEHYKQVIALAVKDEPKILAYYNMGNALFDLGEYEEAVKAYQEAIKFDPKLSKPHNNLGLAYAALNRLQEAISEFSEAVRLKKNYADAHYNLGVAYWQTGKKTEAQEQQEALARLKSPLAEKLGDFLKAN